MEINYQTKIIDLLSAYPNTIKIFKENGFNFQSTDELIEAMPKGAMLGTILIAKSINVETFIHTLNETIGSNCPMAAIDYPFYHSDKHVNLFVKTPCPVNAMLKENLSVFLHNHEIETGIKTNCYLADSCDATSDTEPFWKKNHIDDVPDIIMSMSFDEIYDKQFMDKFVKKGAFENVLTSEKSQFTNEAFQDDSYTLSASLAMVFLVDEKRLAELGLPKPTKWADILDPMYKNEIISLGDEHSGAFTYPLFYVHQAFGLDGIKKLASNTKDVVTVK